MKKIRYVLCLFGTVGCALAQPSIGNHVASRIIVQHRKGADTTLTAQALAANGAQVEKTIPQIGISVLRLPEAASPRVQAALMRTGLFNFVEPDFIAHGISTTPNDPDFSSQWHLTAISAQNAWSVTTGASSVPIAMIDSGVDSTHPDLSSKIIAGWNYVTGTSNTADDQGHGTATGGTVAAATNNGTGVAGVTWGSPIMPLVVLDSTNYASYSNIASAITYAADHGVRVMNISIGGTSASSTMQSAVNYAWNKGAVIFASAGNYANSSPIYPAACTNVVSVSASDVNGTFASFSSYGSWIDLSAPGDNILTTTRGGGYSYWAGTSFSSPIAAGIAALVLSVRPSLSNSALVSLLEQNSDDLGTPGWDQYFGYGQVDAYKAVMAASSSPNATPPSVSISSPTTGATVSGTTQVQGTATAGAGLSSIQFLVDGQSVASTTTSPFSFSWNTTNAANASHTLTTNATDVLGNVATASVTVTVSNTTVVDTTPPTATITNPLNGSTVNGNVNITVSATDNVGVSQVSMYVDGVLKCTDTVAPYTCTWNPKKVASGSHTIAATAWDKAGNAGYAAAITVHK